MELGEQKKEKGGFHPLLALRLMIESSGKKNDKSKKRV